MWYIAYLLYIYSLFWMRNPGTQLLRGVGLPIFCQTINKKNTKVLAKTCVCVCVFIFYVFVYSQSSSSLKWKRTEFVFAESVVVVLVFGKHSKPNIISLPTLRGQFWEDPV